MCVNERDETGKRGSPRFCTQGELASPGAGGAPGAGVAERPEAAATERGTGRPAAEAREEEVADLPEHEVTGQDASKNALEAQGTKEMVATDERGYQFHRDHR